MPKRSPKHPFFAHKCRTSVGCSEELATFQKSSTPDQLSFVTNPSNLVLHLRGGDVFKANAHTGYIQYPISHLLDVISKFDYSLIVHEDSSIPSLPILKARGVILQCSDIVTDFSTLVNSANLAFGGISTFPIAACILQPKRQTLILAGSVTVDNLFRSIVRRNKVIFRPLPDYIPESGWIPNSSTTIEMYFKYNASDAFVHLCDDSDKTIPLKSQLD